MLKRAAFVLIVLALAFALPAAAQSDKYPITGQIGHGVGGPIDGMQLKVDGYSAPGDYFITFKARVK